LDNIAKPCPKKRERRKKGRREGMKEGRREGGRKGRKEGNTYFEPHP
jgi:flagellar biosynthesis/type III secretory pathway protein FliH